MAIATALQLEGARAMPVLFRFNYDAMSSLKSLNLSDKLPYYSVFCCWYIALRCDLNLWPWDLDLWPLILNIFSVSPVTWWNFVAYLNAVEQSAAMHTTRFHGPCSRVSKTSSVNTGREHGHVNRGACPHGPCSPLTFSTSVNTGREIE